MTDPIWTPRKGDYAKLTVTKTWGEKKGQPVLVRLVQITKVSRAGYLSIAERRDERYERVGPRSFRDWQPKSFMFRDFDDRLEPATAEEIETLPRDLPGARALAQQLREAGA